MSDSIKCELCGKTIKTEGKAWWELKSFEKVCCGSEKCWRKAQEAYDFNKMKYHKPKGQTGGGEKISKNFM